MNNGEKQPVTVESLIRLKRIEQPAPEFWAQFNSDLRAKQLAAIVEKPRWWERRSRVYGIFSRHPLALGTAAALAVAVFSVGEYRGTRVSSPVAAGPDEDAYATAAAAAPGPSEAPAALRSSPLQAPARSAIVEARSVPVKSAEESYGRESRPTAAAPIASAAVAPDAARDESMQFERSDRNVVSLGRSLSAMNLAAIQAAEVAHDQFALSKSFESPVSADGGSQAVEPLARMTSPSDERRSRIMGDAVVQTASFEGGTVSPSDHFASRLPDDRVFDSISRYASDSDRLSIRF